MPKLIPEQDGEEHFTEIYDILGQNSRNYIEFN
jgi:hypothetical protein